MLCAFTPVSLQIHSRGLGKEYLFCTTVGALTNIGLNMVLIPSWGMLAAGITTLVAEAVSMLCCCLVLLRANRRLAALA